MGIRLGYGTIVGMAVGVQGRTPASPTPPARADSAPAVADRPDGGWRRAWRAWNVRDAEWFPVLAGHRSLSTVQGYEWLGKGAWDLQASRDYSLQLCAFETVTCLEEWTQDVQVVGAWVFVPVSTIETLSPTGDCCAGFRASLEGSRAWEVVFKGPGGEVFKPRS